jgi:hypothetical protein
MFSCFTALRFFADAVLKTALQIVRDALHGGRHVHGAHAGE